jgi:hypothetical protein
MKALSKGLWAPIVTPKSGMPWVVWTDIRSTRREAKAAYLECIDIEFQKKHLERVRFARVDISEAQS